jgi:hypothetical protein
VDVLLPEHAALLRSSAISDEVAVARGYRSVTEKVVLGRYGFSPAQCRVPALLIPVWNLWGEVGGYQARPDHPRVLEGKAVKYETPAGSRMLLDIPPAAVDRLGDPAWPLFITEGARKADAAVSQGLCCIALLGVWNWRGKNERGGSVALPDWELVALNGRTVFVAFDSDVMVKPQVQHALDRFKRFLEARGAEVVVCRLPCREGVVKIGLDDFFASGKTVEDLLATAKARASVRRRPGSGHFA